MTDNNHRPKRAMVLAAGLGTRMRPLTDSTPKPMIRVWKKTMLDHGLDALANAGVNQAIVNVHYLADQIEEHVKTRAMPNVIISNERARLLDSGGGIRNALDVLGSDPFYLLNADSFWVEGAVPNLDRLANSWKPSRMDMLLMVAPTDCTVGFDGAGDFFMDRAGMLSRRGEQISAPFAYTGAAIISPTVFENTPDGPFSLNRLFDTAIESGRLFGMKMDGLWLHVGTPEAINLAEHAIAHHVA